MRFVGKVVLVTGADSGIGLETADRFAKEGAVLALLSNRESELAGTERRFRSQGYDARAFPADVSDPAAVDQAVAGVIGAFGKIDVLINNAGIAWEEPFLEIKPANWSRIVDVNLNGMFYVAQRTAKEMAAAQSGCIINMSSTNGFAGEEKYAHYNASKAGVVLLTRTMAVELGRYGIRVNAVCPGYIQTPMSEAIDSPEFVEAYIRNHIPLGRAGRTKDVSGVFAFLASDDAAFINGETIVVDGGQLAQ